MASKKISLDEITKSINANTPTISIGNNGINITANNNLSSFASYIDYSTTYPGQVTRRCTYKDCTKESLKRILKETPQEIKQMVLDGVEFEDDELVEIIANGSIAAAEMLLCTDYPISKAVTKAIIDKITVPHSSYIKKYMHRLMMPYNEMLDYNFIMGTVIDLTLYVCDSNILNTANDKVLYWVFKDPRLTEEFISTCNDYIKKMYKKYKLTLKFMDTTADSKSNYNSYIYSYDIKKDIELFNSIFGEDEE